MPVDMQQRQQDARPRLPVARLDDNGARRAVMELFASIIKVRAGHDGQETLRRDEPLGTIQRVPEH
ncbi:protein of unknown function [Candidatus Methylomirabilis oxygeniifera]|uniref:Uncharacterized protein n=1 Tax=Methylomirabilis oxygeniifera TaxID=671143 RepID=D5MEK0_METO1|nr:protein of unknown function [Candidatus Methylomirabilis oxyfera]